MSTETARAALAADADGWFKSSYSGAQNGCVEINRRVPGYAGVRDSKLGDASPILAFSTTAMRALLDSLVR